jgi:hypothetical protein
MMRHLFLLAAVFLGCALRAPAAETNTVVLIVSDGLRWQEIFTGAEEQLLGDKGGNWVPEQELRKRYWRADSKQRRELLFPFLWGTIAKQGQLFGNQHLGSIAKVSNDKDFSYPGYNEMSTGYANNAIDKNEFGPNPNPGVFEWLNKDPKFKGKVAIYGTWQIFDDIFRRSQSGLIMQTGWAVPHLSGDAGGERMLARIFGSLSRFDEEDLPDSLLQVPLLDFIKGQTVRVLFVGYGETDNWAHQGRYDLVLEAAHRFDANVKELWETMQSLPAYRGHTTFLLTADHGRGSGPTEWKEHGVEEKGSENIWLAVMGPDTKPLGERSHVAPVLQAQIAATLASFVGKDYTQAEPRAAKPVTEVLSADHGK